MAYDIVFLKSLVTWENFQKLRKCNPLQKPKLVLSGAVGSCCTVQLFKSVSGQSRSFFPKT